MRKTLGILAASAFAVVASAIPAQATVWKGITWTDDVTGGATWTTPGSNAVVTRTGAGTGGADNNLRAVGVGGGGISGAGSGASTTWYFTASFIDNQNVDGTWPIMQVFYDGTVDSSTYGNNSRNFRGGIAAGYPEDQNNQFRLEAGINDSNQVGTGTFGNTSKPLPSANAYVGLYGEAKWTPQAADTSVAAPTAGTKRINSIYAVTSGSAKATTSGNSLAAAGFGTLKTRTDGSFVSVRVGKLADGTLEYTWWYGSDGTVTTDAFGKDVYGNNPKYIYSDAFNKNAPAAAAADWLNWKLDQVELRTIGTDASTESYTWTNFQAGAGYVTDIPEPASLGLMGLGSMLILARRRKTA